MLFLLISSNVFIIVALVPVCLFALKVLCCFCLSLFNCFNYQWCKLLAFRRISPILSSIWSFL